MSTRAARSATLPNQILHACSNWVIDDQLKFANAAQQQMHLAFVQPRLPSIAHFVRYGMRDLARAKTRLLWAPLKQEKARSAAPRALLLRPECPLPAVASSRSTDRSWPESRRCRPPAHVESARCSTSFSERSREGGPSNLLIGLVAHFNIHFYEPRGREFESLQARHYNGT
jgi:hypothetical protein